jgi:hypothetical protein
MRRYDASSELRLASSVRCSVVCLRGRSLCHDILSGSTPDGALHQTTYTFTINGGETHTPGFSLDTVYAVTWNANTGCYAQAQSVGGKAILWHSPCAALSYCWWHWSGSGSVNMVCKQYW